MEIELKYRVSNLKEILETLNKNGAEFKKEKLEKDIYFNVSGRDSYTTKECLRIRSSSDGFAEITYKPPTEAKTKSEHFAKKETNLRISDPSEAELLLSLLGNTILVAVIKKRRYYSLNGCVVCIDEVQNVGHFAEVEVEDDDEERGLTRVKECGLLLGFSNAQIERKPYRDLVWESQGSMPLNK